MKKNARNFILLLIGSALGSILMFLSQILLARNFSMEDYGTFVTVSNLVNIIAIFVGFGTGDFLIKVFSQEGKQAYRWVKSSFKIFYLSIFIVFLIIFSIISMKIYSPSINILLFLFLPNILLQGFLTLSNAVNQLEKNFLKVAVFNLSIYLVRFLGVLLALLTSNDIAGIGITIFVLSCILLFPFWINIRKFLSESIIMENFYVSKVEKTANFKNSFAQIYPFGLMGLLYFVYYQSDILIISFYQGTEATALYSAAFAFISLIFIFPNLIFRKLFLAKIHTWATHNPLKLINFYKKSNYFMGIIGGIAFLITLSLSQYIIPIIYGDAYVKSIYYLELLSITILFRFLSSISGTILSTRNQITLKLKVQGGIALFNIVLNFILIPTYGIVGAIVSTILSEFLLFVIFSWYTKKYLLLIVKGV